MITLCVECRRSLDEDFLSVEGRCAACFMAEKLFMESAPKGISYIGRIPAWAILRSISAMEEEMMRLNKNDGSFSIAEKTWFTLSNAFAPYALNPSCSEKGRDVVLSMCEDRRAAMAARLLEEPVSSVGNVILEYLYANSEFATYPGSPDGVVIFRPHEDVEEPLPTKDSEVFYFDGDTQKFVRDLMVNGEVVMRRRSVLDEQR